MAEFSDKSNSEWLLSEYLDGNLGRRQRIEFEERLAKDEALRAELRRYAGLDGLLAEMAEEPVDADYDAQRREVMAAIERRMLLEGRSRRAWILRPAWVAPLAAAAACIIAAFIFLLPGKQRTAPQTPVPTVAVRLLPASAQPMIEGKVTVEFHRPAWDQVNVAEAASANDIITAAPAGTVVVSVGSSDSQDAPLLW